MSAAPREGESLALLEPIARPRITRTAARVLRNERVTNRYWLLELEAPAIAATALPGQFAMITPSRPGESDHALPRPMAVYQTNPATGSVIFAYAVIGRGTRALTTFRSGEALETVGPLGRPFDLGTANSVLVIGRGVGSCSLTLLAAEAIARGAAVTAVDSAREAGGGMAAPMLRRLGVPVLEISDAEGTSEVATLEAALHLAHDDVPPALVAVCGSTRLIALATRLAEVWGAEVQVSVEAHMACGMGYCHGCASGFRAASEESPLVCKDGPVFRITR